MPEYMPPTMVTRDLDAVKDFQARHGAVVIKPLHGNGGKAVFKIDADGSNLGALVELFGQVWPEPFMVQQFLPSVSQGDKRIVLIDGEVAGAINRKPGEGEFRSNLAVGGYAEAATLTPREQEICAVLGPQLRERGLVFVGIDVIGGEWLTEINVTSPDRHRRDRPVQQQRYGGHDLGRDRPTDRLTRPARYPRHDRFHPEPDPELGLCGDLHPHVPRECVPADPVRSHHGARRHRRRQGPFRFLDPRRGRGGGDDRGQLGVVRHRALDRLSSG